MSIRDIIEAATFTKPQANRWKLFEDSFTEELLLRTADGCNVAEEFASDEYAHYIATFDPEHVALMEAVIEETRRFWYGDEDTADGDPALAYANLEAYRRERGLL